LKDIRSNAEGEYVAGSTDQWTVDTYVEDTVWVKVAYFYTKHHLKEDGISLNQSKRSDLIFPRLNIKLTVKVDYLL